ncbi:MAG TPA: efflux RND transporter periplasmic adaptor subunit [Terriglobales bacterium]|nr:efflux RND transporter periplasmic adaptor subunit [Terriglobales bacterium]
MKNKKHWILLAVVVAAIAGYAYFRNDSNQAVQYFQAEVTKGNIRSVVEATGTINAVTTVQVGSQVSGTISRLNADFNSQVRKGQVIAQIDPSIFEGNLLQARADLENARANLAAARANLDKSKAAAVQAKADYDRTIALSKEGVLSQQQLEVAKSNSDSAAASVSASQAQVVQAQAQVSQRSAAVQVSKTNMDHTTIVAPVDGIVINRTVDVGQTVAASLQAPTLFTIAQDLTKMQVYTKTDESDIGRIRSGQPVSFKVDAFPNETFNGKVQQVRMNATVVQNVVTYDTVIEFENPDQKLFPGMTAYVTIPVASARDVLRVPNASLRFKPDMKQEEIRALYQKYGIDTGRQQNAEGQPEGGEATTAAGAQSSSPNGGGERRRAQGAPSGQPANGDASAEQTGMRRRRGGMAPGEQAGGGVEPASQRPAPRRIQTAIIWKLNPDKTLRPVQVKTGITDLNLTEIVEGELKEGEQVVTGSSSPRQGGASPLGRQPQGGQRR